MTGDRGHRLVPPTGTSTATYPGAVSDFASFDLDLEVARAWTRFQADLAGRLADLADLGHLVIEVETAPEESDEPARFVQFAVEEPTVRLEVSASTAASDPHRLSPDDERHLYDLGLQPPDFDNVSEEGTPNWFIDGEIDDADRLSVIAVRVLRKVFGIPHPAFLIGAGMAIEVRASTKPMSSRRARMSVAPSRLPSTSTDPSEGCESAAARWRRVVLPAPFGPSITQCCPGSTRQSIS